MCTENPKEEGSKVTASLSFGDTLPADSFAILAPHSMHISVTDIVGVPHQGQKLVPAIGLVPQ